MVTVSLPKFHALSAEGGGCSPEGDIVSGSRPYSKGRVPRPGGSPIYVGQQQIRRRQRLQKKRPHKGGGGEFSGGGRSLLSLLITQPLTELMNEYHLQKGYQNSFEIANLDQQYYFDFYE